METKLRAGNQLVKVDLTPIGNNKLRIKSPFHRGLIEEIKMMKGARWNPEGKFWTVEDTFRNHFTLMYMQGEKVYARYDKELIDWEPYPRLCPKGKCERCDFTGFVNPYDHQVEMVRHILTRRHCHLAVEMGAGKTLAAIYAMEYHQENYGQNKWIWVGPKSALAAVQLEFKLWKSKVKPEFHTYESLKKFVSVMDHDIPDGIIFDESSRVKTPTSQRSEAAKQLADKIRIKDQSLIVLMSGTPAPKSPLDWYWQAEIACPGFLKEGDIHKFKRTLAIVIQKESLSGGVYPQLLGWRDSETKCDTCGKEEKEPEHDLDGVTYHPFKPAVNEVARLYRRLKGITLVKFKKDCLSLPEIQYRTIECKPTRSILNAAKIIEARSERAITALTLLRELSDGFQYEETESGTKRCDICNGTGDADQTISPGEISCPQCGGSGQVPSYKRSAKQIPCPKEDVLIDLLDQHEDIGRFVVYAGFQGSLDRIESIIIKQKWQPIKVDGRGWQSNIPGKASDLLNVFQYEQEKYPKVVYLAQPGAGGLGVTLTASPTILFYSNDFNSESRLQAEHRIHRMGMDLNRGATIIDLEHLPTDKYVIENLRKKRKLQDISMGELREETMRFLKSSEVER